MPPRWYDKTEPEIGQRMLWLPEWVSPTRALSLRLERELLPHNVRRETE